MGRRRDNKPAVCPHCAKSFEAAGKDRYQNLKRHVDNVHPVRTAAAATVIGNQQNIGQQVNIHLHVNSFAGCDFAALKACLHEVIAECAALNIPRIPEMMARLHETNATAVIPNLNRDEMLLKVDGRAVSVTKMVGADMCAKAFMEDAPRELGDVLPGHALKTIDVLSKNMECETAKNLKEDFVKRLIARTPEARRITAKIMRDSAPE